MFPTTQYRHALFDSINSIYPLLTGTNQWVYFFPLPDMYKLYSIIRKNTIKTPKKNCLEDTLFMSNASVYAVIKCCEDYVSRVLKYMEEYDAVEKSI